MTAIEKLNAFSANVAAERARVEKQHATLAQGIALISKHGVRTIAEAIHAEAVSRAITA